MDFKTRMKRIYEFLQPYQRIWQNEIMLLYPHSFDPFPSDWLDEISKIKDLESLVLLEKKYHQTVIKNPELYSFYDKVESLTRFDSPRPRAGLPTNKYTWHKVIPKKQHEIQKLAPIINDYYKEHHIENIVDIGGGLGLLSQTLCNAYKLQVTSLDMDSKLQEAGQKRYLKYGTEKEKLTFKKVRVSKEEESFLEELGPQKMTLGLHTCGPLAVSQIVSSVKKDVKAIVNLGCCYLKLSSEGDDQNISSFSQSFSPPLIMNQFALTLACGAHRKVSFESVSFKQQVKFYRYSLHALLADHYDRSEIIIFGNSSGKDYNSSFYDYVKTQFKKVGIPLKHTNEELLEFYEEKLPIVKRMYAAGFIRDALSRLLEVYLLLDRAIYLEENGYKVEILEVFDEEVSPRNLGIFAHLE